MTDVKAVKSHGRVVRLCSVLLSFLLLLSMMYVGNVGSMNASAAGKTDVLYFDFGVSGGWIANGTEATQDDPNTYLAVWWWGDSNSGTFNYLTMVDKSNKIFKLDIPTGKSCTGIILFRLKNTNIADGVTTYPEDLYDANIGNNSYDGFKVQMDLSSMTSAQNCIWMKTNNGGDSGFKEYTPPEPSGGKVYSNIPLINNDSSIKLLQANVTFYDYLTDYELDHGWMSQSSVTSDSTYPYSRFNEYISGLVGSAGGEWTYPLYFGDFSSPWTNYSNFPYATAKDNGMYLADGTYCANGDNYFALNRTNGKNLFNFSIYSNNSEPLNYKLGTSTYQGSVQGLVQSTLQSGNLYMTNYNSLSSPYFQSNAYTNVVSTKFPLRAVTNNSDGNGNTFTSYVFDSGSGAAVESDLVNFRYDDGEPYEFRYNYGTNANVLDMKGNSGFFPFEGTYTSEPTTAKNYGFGMKLEIPFNLTADGYVKSRDANGQLHDTSIPMSFTFQGDDDVWVFIDGKLALDLGGDHGNSSGYINFANTTKDGYDSSTYGTIGTGTTTTGAVNLLSSPNYGGTEVSDTTTVTKNIPALIGTKADGTYDVTKNHTLTMFYMERGLFESNLQMSITMSPIGNELSLEDTVDLSNVNTNYKQRVKTAIAKDTFNYAFTDSEKADISGYEYSNGSEIKTLGSNGSSNSNGVDMHPDDAISFTDQFTDGCSISITQNPASGNGYSYTNTTLYTVIDELIKDRKAEGYTETASEYIYNAQSFTSTEAVSFDFASLSNADRKYNNFSVLAKNAINVGSVTLTKNLENGNSADDNKEFEFEVYVKLPNEDDFVKETNTVKLKNGQSYSINNLPVNTQVKFKELDSDSNDAYEFKETDKGNSDEVTLTVSTTAQTVTYTNTKLTGDATITATKTLDGVAPANGETFNFALTELTADNTKSTNVTSAQNSGGSITFSFTGLDVGTTYKYLLEETSTTDATYTCDTNVYWVEVIPRKSPTTATVSYYHASKSGDTYTKGTSVGSVTFNNTTNVQNGYLKVVKQITGGTTNSNLVGAEFTYTRVTAENSTTPDGSTSGTLTVESDANSEVSAMTGGIPVGWYMVSETKAPDGYQLDTTPQWIQVTTANTTASPATLTFSDTAKTTLPETGGIGVVVIAVGGIALIALGFFLLRPSKKKENSSKDDSDDT